MQLKKYFTLLVVPLFLTSIVNANLPVDPGDYTGSRTKSLLTNPDGGLEGFGAAAPLPYSMMWTITDNLNGSYTFDYDFSLLSGITSYNFFIESTSGVGASNLSDVTVNGILFNPNTAFVDDTILGVTGISFSNSLIIPTSITSVSFKVSAIPEWGSFLHGELLGFGIITNEDYGLSPTGPDFTNFIPVIGVATPEPSTYLFLGSALGVVGLCLSRRRRKHSC